MERAHVHDEGSYHDRRQFERFPGHDVRLITGAEGSDLPRVQSGKISTPSIYCESSIHCSARARNLGHALNVFARWRGPDSGCLAEQSGQRLEGAKQEQQPRGHM
jgi:hypothetical protein